MMQPTSFRNFFPRCKCRCTNSFPEHFSVCLSCFRAVFSIAVRFLEYEFVEVFGFFLLLIEILSIWLSEAKENTTCTVTSSCSDLYFARCFALKRTGAYALESKVICLF